MTEIQTETDPTTKELEVTKVIYSKKRMITGLITTLAGFFILVLGAKPSAFGFDRSPVIGFVQTAVFLIGLGVICIGGYLCLMVFWPKDFTSLTADFGLRLVTTGFVIAVFSGMADVFGIGSHPVSLMLFFGPLQALGVELGEMVIGVGMVMMILPPGKNVRHKQEDNKVHIDMTQS